MKTLTGLWPNLSRAYEIAKLGDFTITITYQKTSEYVGVSDDYKTIKKFYKDVKFVKNGDLWVSIQKPKSYSDIHNYETLEDIHERVKKAKTYKLPKDIFDSASEELLKNGVQRLSFSLKDVTTIHKVARIVAQLENSSIDIHHVAEAMNYKIKNDFHDDKLIVVADSVLYFGKYIAINQAGLDGMYADEEKNIKKAIRYLKSLL